MKLLLFSLLLMISSFVSIASERLMAIIFNTPDDYYVVQIASLPAMTDLEGAVKELNYKKRLVAVKTLVKEKQHWVILEGIYSNQKEAQQVVKEIQASYKQIAAWARPMSSLKRVLTVKSVK